MLIEQFPMLLNCEAIFFTKNVIQYKNRNISNRPAFVGIAHKKSHSTSMNKKNLALKLILAHIHAHYSAIIVPSEGFEYHTYKELIKNWYITYLMIVTHSYCIYTVCVASIRFSTVGQINMCVQKL